MEFLELILSAKSGDKKSRDLLVEKNVGLVWSVVRRFGNRGHDMEDLFQIGVIGLIKAIDYFDTSFDVRFSTYAVPMISGEIKRFLRDDGMIKVSRSLKEQAWKVQRAREQWMHDNGCEASLSDLCACTGLESEDVISAVESGCEVESLNKVIFQNDGQPVRLVDKLVEKKDVHGELLNRLLIHQLLERLNARERELIILRYYCNETQSKIASCFGISQVQVSRMEKRVLKQLREWLKCNEFYEESSDKKQ